MNYHSFRAIALCLIASAVFAACSDPNAANEGNFLAAIQKDASHYDQRQCTSGVQLPARVSDRTAFGMLNNNTSQYDELRHLGLVSTKHSSVYHPAQFFQAAWTERIAQYTITPTGARYARAQTGTFGGQQIAFCYAVKAPERITNFTVPGDLNGMKVSQVRYTYGLSQIAPWANDPDIGAAFPEISSTIAGEHNQEQTIALTLTNNGWEVLR